MTLNKKNLNNLFFIFALSHLIIWTIIPSTTNNNLPLDTIEALAWGSNLDWGFNKHPPMSAFLVEIFYQIFGSQDWAYYLLMKVWQSTQLSALIKKCKINLLISFYLWPFLTIYTINASLTPIY